MSYAKFNANVQIDDYASYPDADDHDLKEASSEPTLYRVADVIEADTNGTFPLTSYIIDRLTTVYGLIVEHIDSTNDDVVNVAWDSTGGTSCEADISYGGLPLILSDVDPATALTFESDAASTPKLRVTYWGV